MIYPPATKKGVTVDLPSFDFGLGDFELSSDVFDFIDDREPTEQETMVRPVVMRPQCVAYEYAQDFAEQLRLDNETETFAFVSGNFVFGDFVEALVDMGRLSVRRMSLMTLSLNDENIDSIRNIIEWENVERLDLVVSDYWFSHERHAGGLVDYLFDELTVAGMELNVGFAAVHCKTWCIETRQGNCLTIQGSANLRSSRNIEQVHISPSKELFEFVDGFTQKVIDVYNVVNKDAQRIKGIRSGQLWQAAVVEAAAAQGDKGADAAAAQGQGEAETVGQAETASAGQGAKDAGTTYTAKCRSSR